MRRARRHRRVDTALGAGASGVVLGALTADSRVDRSALARLLDGIDLSSVDVTFHRAMDVVDDRATALDTLADARITRVLTSGGAPRCIDGLESLSRTVTDANGRIQVMAGGGIRVEDIAAVAGTGVDAVHLSA
nr:MULTISPECIES: copper homeostasis protein CutC [unclassified Rhodococcus (in: high G+C Gram-positive bacteria)]